MILTCFKSFQTIWDELSKTAVRYDTHAHTVCDRTCLRAWPCNSMCRFVLWAAHEEIMKMKKNTNPANYRLVRHAITKHEAQRTRIRNNITCHRFQTSGTSTHTHTHTHTFLQPFGVLSIPMLAQSGILAMQLHRNIPILSWR